MESKNFIHQALPSDVRKVIVGEEEQQEWSSTLDQEEPEPPHIKEEPEDLWTNRGGVQLEDTDDESGESSELKVEFSDDDWKESREPQSGLNFLRNDDVGNSRCNSEEKPFSCSVCGKTFGTKRYLRKHLRIHLGDKPFSCSLCDKRFLQKVHLKRHMRYHTGEKPFSCSVCERCFACSRSLALHMNVHTGEKPFSCGECGKRYGRKSNLWRHVRMHAEESVFSCSVCEKTFTEKAGLQRHMRIHTGEKPFSCSICEQRFTWSKQLKNHRCVDHPSQMEAEADAENSGGPDPHLHPDAEEKTGDISEPETDDSDDWKETREPQSGLNSLKNEDVPDSSAGEKPFCCSECGKTFGLKATLKRHMITHSGEKPFSCPFCKKYFAWKGRLQTHLRIHTGEKPFSCSVCGKAFGESGNLKRHMSIHTGEKRFSCDVCDRRFSWYTSFKNHKCGSSRRRRSSKLQTEQTEREADGDDCGGPEPDPHLEPDTEDKSGDFSEPEIEDGDDWKEPQSGLNSLKNDEVPEKPFSCSECGKRFGRNSHLREHMITHTGEKPFSCPICSKGFRRNRTLQLHMKTHTGEEPFSCSVCSKKFTERTTMTDHMRTHTGEKPFSCSVCNKSFAWRSQLKNHACVSRSSQICQSQTAEDREAEPPHSTDLCYQSTSAYPGNIYVVWPQ